MLVAQVVLGPVYNAGTVSGGTGTWFGRSIVPIGDVDQDGLADFLCTAPFSQQAVWSNGSGLARVVSGGSRAIVRDHWGTSPADYDLGYAADGGEDADGDGISDYALSSPARGAGSIYLFSGSTGALVRAMQGVNLGDGMGTFVGMADCNGDGYADVLGGSDAASVVGGFRPQIRAWSGRDGSLLWVVNEIQPVYNMSLCGIVEVGDVNNDGCQDIATARNIRSGVDGSVLSVFPYPSVSDSPRSIAAAGDVNGDGVCDVIVGCPQSNAAYLFSAASGMLFRTHTSPIPGDDYGFAVAGSLNADDDGLADYIVRGRFTIQWTLFQGRAEIFRGSDGGLLQSWITYPMERLGGAAVVGDTNGDGSDEVVFGAEENNAYGYHSGVVYVYQLRSGPVGKVRTYGAGCPGTALRIPTATVTGLPRTGSSFAFEVRAVSPSSFAVCAAGDPNTVPLAGIGAPGCFAHVNPYWLGILPTDAVGRASLAIAIPSNPSLVGARVDSQWADFDPAANALGLITSTAAALFVGP